MKHKIIYTKQECFEKAKKYRNKSEFRTKDWVAFMQCVENGWIDEIKPSKIKVKTYEECYETAEKYNDYSTFRSQEPKVYNKVIRNGWIKDYTWLKKGNRDPDAKINCVYAFEFPSTNSAYVGRTMDKSRRYSQHLSDIKDGVYKHIIENNFTENDFIYRIIMDKLTLYESVEKECEYIEKYKNEGWKVLNKAKGGSIGSPFVIWTHENTFNKAKEYVYLKDFSENTGAYSAALKNGWLKEFTWLEYFKPSKIYTYEMCFEKAKKCVTHYEFYKKYKSYVTFAKRKGWYDDYTWLKNKRHEIIVEYDLNGDFVKTYEKISLMENINNSCVTNCLKGRIKQHNNRTWRYGEDLIEKYGEIPKHIDIDFTPSNFRAIVQYDLKGNFISEYKTIKDCGFCANSVLPVLQGKTHTSHGFLWRYKEDVLNDDGTIKQKITYNLINKKLKSLLQYDKQGNFIKEYNTQTEAINHGFLRKDIEWTANKKYLNKNDFYKYDFIWLLKNEVIEKYNEIPKKIDFSCFIIC